MANPSPAQTPQKFNAINFPEKAQPLTHAFFFPQSKTMKRVLRETNDNRASTLGPGKFQPTPKLNPVIFNFTATPG